MTDKLLTAEEIAEILKINYVNALEFIKYSGIHYIKIGKQYRVSENVFNKFIDSTRQNQIIKF